MGDIQKVILVGFMASGKSAVAKRLAPRLGYTPYHMDDLILAQTQYPTIRVLFEDKGEAFFRDIEAQIALSLRNVQEAVIATGGGVVTRPSNIENLKSNGGIVVFLRSSFKSIAERIGDPNSRPLFKDKKNAEELFNQRAPIYESYADLIVDTDERSIEDVCSLIVAEVESRLCRS